MSPISEETVKQTVILLFTVATAAAVMAFSDSDFLRTTKMMTAQKVQARSNKTALWFLNLADKAEALYERERM